MLRKQTVESVFGIIKSMMGFRQLLTRGLDNVQGEWTLVCLARNLKRMAVLRSHKKSQKKLRISPRIDHFLQKTAIKPLLRGPSPTGC